MRIALSLAVAACLLGACSSTTDLQPAPPERPLNTEGVPSRTVASARIVVGDAVIESAGRLDPQRPKNLVLFIADGFGPASATMGRAAKGAPLAFDSLLVGASETSASDSRVTDSAAGATAYSCGLKTYNGAIGMDASGTPCPTILERAEAAGLATGLVATSRITHATPASFAAHVPTRGQEDDIAEQLALSDVDLLLGGGARYFDGSERADLFHNCCNVGLRWFTTLEELRALDSIDPGDNPVPVVGLFAADHLAYEIDRDPAAEPSLAEMTRRALDLLSASADGAARGFFVMIEGSRIDHAAHSNDPGAHLGDILAFDAAVAEALAWAAADGETLVVSTADHETGGMTLGQGGIYAWDPAPLLAATASFDGMGARLAAGDDPATVLAEGLGTGLLEADDVTALEAALRRRDPAAARRALSVAASRQANIGWTTGGHSAVDVGLYAWGPGAGRLRGAMGNDEVGRRLADLLLGE